MNTGADSSETVRRRFRTNTGVCRITDRRLELERTGWRGWIASVLFGDSISRAVAWYLVAGIGLLLWGLYDLAVLGTHLGWLPLTFGAVALANVAMSRDASAAMEIPRDSIERIVAEPPGFPLQRGHFMVHFRRKGEQRRRVIMMPAALTGADDEFREARRLLQQEGLPLEPAE